VATTGRGPGYTPARLGSSRDLQGISVSNIGKWDKWWRRESASRTPVGDTESYEIGASFLDDCQLVEDWGCGPGWFASVRGGRCIGIDGSLSPTADRQADLVEYTSDVEGIFMRHVLEHNYEWRRILANALRSFRKKMVLAIFTPWSDDETKEIKFIEDVGVPHLSFRRADITDMLEGVEWELLERESPNRIYGQEHIFLITRGATLPR
jgi:hypothetical protein